MVIALADLAGLRAAGGQGLYGSGGDLFSDAIFGRDSATCAESLLHVKPDLARGVILTLAALQGRFDAPIGPGSNEEERGKIHHEHRSLFVGARRIAPASEFLLRDLGSRWGGDEASLTYYGSVDATPLFVRLVAGYCAVYGDSILAETFIARDGVQLTVEDSLRSALDWITRSIDRSELGFVEFQRRNPDGIPFQVWKDSGTSYIHSDGRLANWDAPIAAVEVQGYAYDALLGGARVFAGRDPSAAGWLERAESLRAGVLKLLWMPGEEYFAMGLDRDADGHHRQIDSVASNGALLLDTGIFGGLPDAERYVGGLARRICGVDFITEAGIRCRALGEDSLVDFQDYHGAWAVWMKETFDVARGLARQGLIGPARQLGVRLLNAVNVAGANVEFLYVSPDQRVMYDFRESDLRTGSGEIVAGTNRPEAPQTWTVTGALALKWWFGSGRDLHGRAVEVDAQWRQRLEAEVLERIQPLIPHRTAAERERAYARRGDFVLDLALGQAGDRRARERQRGGGSLISGT